MSLKYESIDDAIKNFQVKENELCIFMIGKNHDGIIKNFSYCRPIEDMKNFYQIGEDALRAIVRNLINPNLDQKEFLHKKLREIINSLQKIK